MSEFIICIFLTLNSRRNGRRKEKGEEKEVIEPVRILEECPDCKKPVVIELTDVGQVIVKWGEKK